MLAGAVRTDERQLPEVGQDSDDGDERQRAERLRTRASELDTQPALLSWAKRLRQRLPGDERFGDPLSTAGGTPVQVLARGVSSLQPERDSVAKDRKSTRLN